MSSTRDGLHTAMGSAHGKSSTRSTSRTSARVAWTPQPSLRSPKRDAGGQQPLSSRLRQGLDSPSLAMTPRAATPFRRGLVERTMAAFESGAVGHLRDALRSHREWSYRQMYDESDEHQGGCARPTPSTPHLYEPPEPERVHRPQYLFDV